MTARLGKLRPNWEGIYHVCQKLAHDAYKLKELDIRLISKTQNSSNLRYYYS